MLNGRQWTTSNLLCSMGCCERRLFCFAKWTAEMDVYFDWLNGLLRTTSIFFFFCLAQRAAENDVYFALLNELLKTTSILLCSTGCWVQRLFCFAQRATENDVYFTMLNALQRTTSLLCCRDVCIFCFAHWAEFWAWISLFLCSWCSLCT